MNKIDFKTSGYFPAHVIYFGYFLPLLTLVLLSITLWGALISFLVALIILTTHYRLNIDFDNKVYHDYLWILGLKKGEKGKFNSTEYLFIKKTNIKETMQLRVASSVIQKEVFDGYLKLSEDTKIHLVTMDSREGLVRKLKNIASKLEVRIIDYSEGEPVEI